MSNPVIGFSWPPGHDNAACAIVDGKLVFAVEEERFTRHKHSLGELPLKSLIHVLKRLKQIDVDVSDAFFAIHYNPKYFIYGNYYYPRKYQAFMKYWLRVFVDDTSPHLKRHYFLNLVRMDFSGLARIFLRHCFREAGLAAPRKFTLVPVLHHLAHAASAYYFSGYNHCSVITVDGSGETDSTRVWTVKHGEFQPVLTIGIEESLGYLYEAASQHMGFGFLEGPGKVMGLAPYGSTRQEFREQFHHFVKTSEDGSQPYSFSTKMRSMKQYSDIARTLSCGIDFSHWDHRGSILPKAADFAYSLQESTERALLGLAKWAKRTTGEKDLAMAGGVALNAKSNMRIYYEGDLDDLFVFPIANDAGAPVGAAAWVYEHVVGASMRNERLEHVFFGPEYTDDDIKQVVERAKWNTEYVGDNIGGIADLVAKGSVVAWYQARSELGPRALGHRSIIADPRNKEMWHIMNQIKGREWWRPLAPSVLFEDANKYFVKPVHHPFMILMLRMEKDAAETLPAVCHLDKTSRPQTVRRENNRIWYDLIKAFKDLTGEGIVMNTSFNLAGEPLVETPEDAIRSFSLGGFDAIYLQGWLIRKR